MKQINDIIIIGAWAAGLFAAINIPNKYNKLILEKNPKPWIKVLLSWGERANVSNMDIEPERDYFTQNKKALRSVFSRYNQWDIMSWFAENWINIVEEDRSRLILESWDSKELLEVLVRKAKENNSEIKTKQDVVKVEKISSENFVVTTAEWIEYSWKKVIVSSGWKSFFQVWTTWEWYNFARDFDLNIIPPTRALWWVSTKRDMSDISWASCVLEMRVFDRDIKLSPPPSGTPLKSKGRKELIYSETWPLLFTHFGLSGPIIFNAWNAIGEYISSLKLDTQDKDFWESDIIYENYFKNNISIELTFTTKDTPKKIVKFFELETPINKFWTQIENNIHTLELQNWRSWKEAKATGWWIDMNELDKNFQSKKTPGLFFIGEVCDVTWKTWGFNLQWAWSSAFCCGEDF